MSRFLIFAVSAFILSACGHNHCPIESQFLPDRYDPAVTARKGYLNHNCQSVRYGSTAYINIMGLPYHEMECSHRSTNGLGEDTERLNFIYKYRKVTSPDTFCICANLRGPAKNYTDPTARNFSVSIDSGAPQNMDLRYPNPYAMNDSGCDASGNCSSGWSSAGNIYCISAPGWTKAHSIQLVERNSQESFAWEIASPENE